MSTAHSTALTTLHEQPVAHQLDDAAIVGRDPWIDQVLKRIFEPRPDSLAF